MNDIQHNQRVESQIRVMPFIIGFRKFVTLITYKFKARNYIRF